MIFHSYFFVYQRVCFPQIALNSFSLASVPRTSETSPGCIARATASNSWIWSGKIHGKLHGNIHGESMESMGNPMENPCGNWNKKLKIDGKIFVEHQNDPNIKTTHVEKIMGK